MKLKGMNKMFFYLKNVINIQQVKGKTGVYIIISKRRSRIN